MTIVGEIEEMMKLEDMCYECFGQGKTFGTVLEPVPEGKTCATCNGTRYIPTQFGASVLEFVKKVRRIGMSREIKRVALDFEWPAKKVWDGYLMPPRLRPHDCDTCGGSGYSVEAQHFHDLWYGHASFTPSDTGSELLLPTTPVVFDFAQRNVRRSPDYYGTDPSTALREARRLADLWNSMWMHHLSQQDVDVLVAEGRLRDLTGPDLKISAAQVNLWSVETMGHDAINAYVVIKARCGREGVQRLCPSCNGAGTTEAYPGQRAEAESWEPTQPPEGPGWQLWETVSEGSPLSPVFDASEGLVQWLMSPAYAFGVSSPLTRVQAERLIDNLYAPSLVYSPETGLIPGDQF